MAIQTLRSRLRRATCASMLSLCALACSPADIIDEPANVSASVNDDISTVASVTWTTEKNSVGYVEYGTTRDLEHVTPREPEETTEHSRTLLGLKSDTVYYYRVVTWDGADAAASEVKSFRTGYLPARMRGFDAVGDGHRDFTLLPLLGMTRAVIVLDPDGDIVWYHQDDVHLAEDEVRGTYRAHFSNDGRSVLYNIADIDNPDEGSFIARVALDGSGREDVTIPFLAHDFVEHPDGTIAAIVREDRDVDGKVIKGNRVVEVDPDGNLTEIWSSWNCFDPDDDPGDDMDLGWTFANAIDYNATQQRYYVGMRNFSSIAAVDRMTGECEWVLGFTGATMEFADGSESFLHQHQFQLVGSTLVVFDNMGGRLLENVSRVLEYDIDVEANVATQTSSYIADPSLYAPLLGEPIRYTSGSEARHTFINWGWAGVLEHVDDEGTSTWKVTAPIGAAFGFGGITKSLYPPDELNP